MKSRKPELDGDETEGDEFEDLLRQAGALAVRVEMMPDGPHKEKLRASISELQAIAGEMKSDAESTA